MALRRPSGGDVPPPASGMDASFSGKTGLGLCRGPFPRLFKTLRRGVEWAHMENTEKTEAGKEAAEPSPEAKAKAKFWGLFAVWASLAVVAPVAFIVWRYDLFQPKTSYQFGGWGFIAVAIVAAFAISCLRYVCKGIRGWSMAKQCIKGACCVTVPLLALYFCLSSIASDIDVFLQSLAVVAACETAAIPFNPLPKWVTDRTQGEYEGLIDYAFKKYDERKEGKKK